MVREAPGLLRARVRPSAKGREGEVGPGGVQGEGEVGRSAWVDNVPVRTK